MALETLFLQKRQDLVIEMSQMPGFAILGDNTRHRQRPTKAMIACRCLDPFGMVLVLIEEGFTIIAGRGRKDSSSRYKCLALILQ